MNSDARATMRHEKQGSIIAGSSEMIGRSKERIERWKIPSQGGVGGGRSKVMEDDAIKSWRS